jgi:hypothetical protein
VHRPAAIHLDEFAMKKRAILLWAVVLVFVAGLLGGATYFYVHFVAEYATARCYLDTELTSTADLRGHSYELQPGRITLTIARGKPEDFFRTDSGWHEQVDIDVPFPAEGQRIDLGDARVRLAFHACHGGCMISWDIGTNGAKGWLEFESVSRRAMTVRYYVAVDAYCEQFKPEFRHCEMEFQGRATFRPRSRPEGKYGGKVWSKS